MKRTRRTPRSLELETATYRTIMKELARNKIQPIVLAGGQERYFAKVSSGLSLHVLPTDGTNTMPMMDASARKGYVILTDGTDDIQIDNIDWVISGSKGLKVTAATTCTDGSAARQVGISGATNRNMNVRIRDGSNQAQCDTDDDDIAHSQNTLLVINLNYVYDAANTKWVRMTQP